MGPAWDVARLFICFYIQYNGGAKSQDPIKLGWTDSAGLWRSYVKPLMQAGNEKRCRAIRLLSGLNDDGAKLVNKAFSGRQPILALGSHIIESEKTVQKGIINLLMSEQDTLTLVSLILAPRN